MEFQYRAGDERRSPSPPPPTPLPLAAPSSSGSGSADAHGGDSGGLVLRQPPTPPPPVAADSADELRRQAEKAKIRERILREEAEQWELELEVRREIREELLRLSWPALGRSAAGVLAPPVAASPVGFGSGNAPLQAINHDEDHPIAKVPAASPPVKRKSPDRGAASTVSAATSSKKQKNNLTCMVCGISATSEKAMQDHINGKVHKRKATALLEQLEAMTETGHEAGEEVLVPSGDHTPTKLTMLTNAGALNEVMQMDGYLLCEVCNVRTLDRVTMMCHLEGSKHISKGQKKGQASSKPLDEALMKKGGKGASVQEAATSDMVSSDPEKLVLEVYGVPHTVRRLEGFLLCELCNVKVPSVNGIRHHLSGKKHKNKAKASSDASANDSTGVNEADKVQLMETDTAVIARMAIQLEAPSAKSLEAKVGDDSEVQETTVTSTNDVAIGDNNKTNAKKVRNASASVAAALENNLHDSESLAMEVDSVHHPLQRVNGFLICPCCNVKAPSETIMRSHLSGKKHKHKMALAARVNIKDASILSTGADEVQGSSSKSMKANVEAESAPLPVTQEKSAAAMAPMDVHRSCSPESGKANGEAEPPPSLIITTKVDGPTEVQPATRIEGEHTAAAAQVSSTHMGKSVKTTALPGMPIKIQVEGKVFTVLQEQNGRLSCEPCGVHGCNKDGMILHLYTRTHWDRANLALKKKEQEDAVVVDNDGNGHI
nr:unnamed protein product [Digitaria exilis]